MIKLGKLKYNEGLFSVIAQEVLLGVISYCYYYGY